ncbi:hypothetical protein MKK75_30910 [Methylobacterium sp. J-030]|uniref:hypothetical protein n=1 Tax=Methylobacterium sp. J-030 TaxID=2836627 RepID=UPI001FB99B8E|nr:hypothetical protein [Methylobacterium sp. J-030]MCJ2073144.1 hypothetical protein [Methylobacterium sp. J-030]
MCISLLAGERFLGYLTNYRADGTKYRADRLAEGDGLLTIQERRHQGRKSDPNVLRIISREWLQWLGRGGWSTAPALLGGIGCKPIHPTDRGDPKREVVDAEPKKGCRGAAVDLDRSGRMRISAVGRTDRAMP